MAAAVIADRYSLDREIGRGGMGAVWLGRDAVLGRDVALKRVGALVDGDRPDLARAEREARLAARVNHPHVVAVFDLVEQAGEQWLVMEYVPGSTLAELVRRRDRFSPDEVAPLLAQAADALAAAHAVGIVHRDVKPSNILVTEQGQVKLSDFGIARAQADATLTRTGLVTGSPAYLAPEVASGSPATAASDVWSLGATLFHALTGHPPYDVGENVVAALYRIVHEDPPRPTGAGWLAPLLEATMTRDPARRWPMTQVRDYLATGPAPGPRRGTSSVRAPSAVPAEETQALRAVPGPGPATADRGRRRWWLPVAVLLLALLAAGGFALGARDDGDPGPGTAGPSPSGTPTGPASPTGEPVPEPTDEGIEAFVRDYLRTVTDDPARAFDSLTPAFQRQSGGLPGYRDFWGRVREAEVLRVEPDARDLEVAYRVRYTNTDGSTWRDDVRLRLVHRDGRYLIAGEA